jgi:hypothetical protein
MLATPVSMQSSLSYLLCNVQRTVNEKQQAKHDHHASRCRFLLRSCRYINHLCELSDSSFTCSVCGRSTGLKHLTQWHSTYCRYPAARQHLAELTQQVYEVVVDPDLQGGSGTSGQQQQVGYRSSRKAGWTLLQTLMTVGNDSNTLVMCMCRSSRSRFMSWWWTQTCRDLAQVASSSR